MLIKNKAYSDEVLCDIKRENRPIQIWSVLGAEGEPMHVTLGQYS